MDEARRELGPYRIDRRIAVGGMAEIYLARHRGIEGLERTVVLKRILPKHAENEEFVTMFLDEARLMAALSHPNIAQVLDLGREGGAHYLVMEYVRGPTLGAMLSAARRRAPAGAAATGLPDGAALGIALAIAEALRYVHERRDDLGRPLAIVHRDLNPANVIVSYDGAVKLIDFGIAKAATKVYETRTGVIKGTYGYIAPEALTGTAPVDRRADVFALGILLYEMLVGKHPYEVSDEPNLLDRILEARYKRPKEVRPDLPGALDRTIARCLTPHPEGRPESVAQLVDELARHMGSRGLVPTLAELAALARELVPDEEGPLPLRRPTGLSPRPVFPRETRDAKDGGTKKVVSSIPPDDEPTRAMPILRDEPAPGGAADARAEGTRKVPRPSVPPAAPPIAPAPAPGPTPVVFDDESAPTFPVAPKVDLDALPPPPSVRPPAPERESRPSFPPPPPARTSPPPPPPLPPAPGVSVDTTLQLRPARARLGVHPAVGGIGLIAAGVLAFVAARALGGGPSRPPEALTVVAPLPPPAAPLGPSAPVERPTTPAMRSLRIVTEPAGALVSLGGAESGARTPAVIAVDDRVPTVFVGVSLEGYVPQSREVSSSIGEARFVLEPLPGAGIASEAPAPRRRRGSRPRRVSP